MKHEVVHHPEASHAAYSPQLSGTQTEKAPRPLRQALLRGWRRRCPNCGGGEMFSGYLSVKEDCDICGQAFSHHRADDAPSWLTMLIVGHIVGPLMLAVYQGFALPFWVHAVIWPLLAMTGVLILLPRTKGAIVAFQWAHRMHGFDEK
ncbi:MAG: DUF983 domain-containing protein [Pikeienuella sp.]